MWGNNTAQHNSNNDINNRENHNTYDIRPLDHNNTTLEYEDTTPDHNDTTLEYEGIRPPDHNDTTLQYKGIRPMSTRVRPLIATA